MSDDIRPGVPFEPVVDPAAWRAADFRSEADFVQHLRPEEVAELDQLAESLESTDAETLLVTGPEPIAMPELDRAMAAVYEELAHGRGFVLMRGLPTAGRGVETVRALATALARRLGEPVSQNGRGQRVADVMDTTKGSATPRGYHSSAELRFHTDPASDLVGLCCVHPAESGGESLLASSLSVHNALCVERPDLLEPLYRGFPYHRFGEGRDDDPEITDYPVPVFVFGDGRLSCRFGRNRIDGAAREGGQPLSALEKEALDRFSATAARPELALRFTMVPGDFMFVNNLTVLHARTNFVDNAPPLPPRRLLRYWLAAEAVRPIPPELNFFNRGARGIVAAGATA